MTRPEGCRNPFPIEKGITYPNRLAQRHTLAVPKRNIFDAYYPSITTGAGWLLLHQTCPNPGEYEPLLMLPFFVRIHLASFPEV